MSIECFGPLYLPSSRARQVLKSSVPEDWSLLESAPGAAPAEHDLIQVAIQGESERKVTLTGIDFQVTRSPRPKGITVSRPCGGPIVGRAMIVDLDHEPPEITASSAEIGGMVGSYPNGQALSEPIRFPWTVSVTDPLLLEIIATTEHCYCTWTAEIPWVSGSKQGVISVGSEGHGFTVVDTKGLDSYGIGQDGGWQKSPY